LRQRLIEVFANLHGAGFGDAPRRIVRWFGDLPAVTKLILVGLVLLVLLVLLSPVVAIVAALLFGVSIIALIIRVSQKRSVKEWGIVAVGSVVLMFTFGGISDVLYGIGFVGGGESVSSKEDSSREKVTDTPPASGGVSPSASPSASPYTSPSPSASPYASPLPLAAGDDVDITGEIFGQPQEFNYDGRYVTGQVIDVEGTHIMIVLDPMQGDFILGYPGQTVRVHGEYQGVVSTSGGLSYEAVMADDVESLDE
jgi:hypothetical protein